ncbi:MAG: type II toxin-antitoxin system RelE/ParE family toxin [Candidatus Eremiobacteraeota bacterium]|nr:type II toxin-antitoxin system RelE/ParE family toxin [Candidatus Eremiobacteraeota bacterium]
MFTVLFSKSARKFYDDSNPKLRKRIEKAADELSENPYGYGVKKLKGKLFGYSRYRFGKYRIIFSISEDKKTVLVRLIIPRKNAYK